MTYGAPLECNTGPIMWTGKNEKNMLGRLFNDFQQSVKTLLSYHMSFVEDKDFIAVSRRSKPRAIAQFSGIFNTVMTCGIDFHDIYRTRTSGSQIPAGIAFPARMT